MWVSPHWCMQVYGRATRPTRRPRLAAVFLSTSFAIVCFLGSVSGANADLFTRGPCAAVGFLNHVRVGAKGVGTPSLGRLVDASATIMVTKIF